MHDLSELLGPHGTTSTATLRQHVDAGTVSRWVAAGRLIRLHPGWLTLPELAEDWTVRAHAAVGYTGGVLSHWSALHVHGLLAEGTTRLDVTVPRHRRLRSSRWLRVHRSERPSGGLRIRGLAVTSAARALVDTWGDAHRQRAMRGADRVVRDVVLRGSRSRLVTVDSLRADLSGRPQLPGRAALVELLEYVAAGCESELEIRGLRDVVIVPGLPTPVLQYRVDLPQGPVRLDAAWPEVKIAVEFDGAAFHGRLGDRERDLRRDAALAALGWVVLRFGYRDVTEQPHVCRARLVAVHQQRGSMVPAVGIPRARMPSGRTMPRS
ncbi:MAG TPA: DUF559 domain-containing protein [Blastococcus sp.]|nr:DUF559 domain-containing protein [Blastococcus sp.]